MTASAQLVLGPSDPSIPGTQVPGGRSPAQQSQPDPLVLGDVTELFADQGRVLQIMVGGDQFVPPGSFLLGNEADAQLVQNAGFLDIGQSNRLRHPAKKSEWQKRVQFLCALYLTQTSD